MAAVVLSVRRDPAGRGERTAAAQGIGPSLEAPVVLRDPVVMVAIGLVVYAQTRRRADGARIGVVAGGRHPLRRSRPHAWSWCEACLPGARRLVGEDEAPVEEQLRDSRAGAACTAAATA